MPSLFILGGLGALALYLYSQSSSTTAAVAPPPPPGGAANATLAPTGTGTVTYDPTSYGPLSPGAPGQQAVPSGVAPASAVAAVPNGATPGTPTGAQSTSGAPLFHTGMSDANSGAVIASDEAGNPYLV